jgi:hypothetical protein
LPSKPGATVCLRARALSLSLTHTHTHTHHSLSPSLLHTHTHTTLTHTWLCISLTLCLFVRVCVCVCVCRVSCVRACVCVCRSLSLTHSLTHTQTHTRTHTRTHSLTHTHTAVSKNREGDGAEVSWAKLFSYFSYTMLTWTLKPCCNYRKTIPEFFSWKTHTHKNVSGSAIYFNIMRLSSTSFFLAYNVRSTTCSNNQPTPAGHGSCGKDQLCQLQKWVRCLLKKRGNTVMCCQKKENSSLTQGSEGCVKTIICIFVFLYGQMCHTWIKLRENVQMLSSVKALLVTVYWGSIKALSRLY